MKIREFIYKVEAQLTVTADSLAEAEEKMMRSRERLEHTLNNVEIELVDHQPNEP